MHEKEPNDTPVHEQMLARYKDKTITDSRSPAGNWLGVTLEHAQRGAVRLSVVVKKDMTNPYGNIHGGMMSAMIDETIGWAVVSLDADHYYTSLNLNVDFLYAIKEGDTMTASAHVVRQGKKIIHAECRVHDAQGILLAKATSNLVVTSMKVR
jgi:acyl-coenzyme A thioesterase 13